MIYIVLRMRIACIMSHELFTQLSKTMDKMGRKLMELGQQGTLETSEENQT